MTDDIKKILRELKKGLAEIYGDQLSSVYFMAPTRAGMHTHQIRISM